MNVDVNVNPAFFDFMASQREAKYRIFMGGAGSGKSYFVATDLVLEAFKSRRKCLVLRNENASNRESTFSLLKETIERMGLSKFVTISSTTMNIKVIPTGSEFIFRGVLETSKLLSINSVDTAWLEEASEMNVEAFHEVCSRLRVADRPIRIYISFNPVSKQSWLYDICNNDFYVKENGFLMRSTYLDNINNLPSSYIETLENLKNVAPERYRVFALGRWGNTGKLVYNNWNVEDFDIQDIVKQYPKSLHRCGLDYGFMADETAFVSLLIDLESKQIWVCDELYQKHLLNDAIYKWIADNGYSKSIITADSSEQKSNEELRRLGCRRLKSAKKGAGSINNGIQFIEQFQIHIHPKCEGFISEISDYAYKKDKVTNTYTNTPLDFKNHLMDAMRYALEEYMLARKGVHTMNKAILGL